MSPNTSISSTVEELHGFSSAALRLAPKSMTAGSKSNYSGLWGMSERVRATIDIDVE